MTAEIALLNREAVALAADSAVTLSLPNGQQKILPSANKIFTLSKYNPVGIMVYGNAQLMEVPWEVIIKDYRKKLGTRSCTTLEEHAAEFIAYLAKADNYFPAAAQERFVLSEAEALFVEIRDHLKDTREALSRIPKGSDEDTLTAAEVSANLLKAFVSDMHAAWKRVKPLSELPEDLGQHIRDTYANKIRDTANRIFSGEKLTTGIRKKLLDLAVWSIDRVPVNERERISGVVITGFGSEDVFPSLRAYGVHGVLNGALLYTTQQSVDVATVGAAILPFAQHEQVKAFMEGVDQRYNAKINHFIAEIMTAICDFAVEKAGLEEADADAFARTLQMGKETLMKEVQQRLTDMQRDQFALPVVRVTALLPKSELAAMAEALVNLTSFKRKVSMELETVGGPIDVAVISKGDGFIWVKRKHYFTKEMNPQFFANYYRGDANGQD